MVSEDDVFKLIVDQFRRRVVVTLYLIANHLYFFVNLILRIGGMKDDVCEQVYGPGDMVFQYGSVISGIFFVGISVEIASHTLQAVDDIPCFSVLGTFESDVLAEVSEPFFTLCFIARSNADLVSAIYYGRGRRPVNDTKPVGESSGGISHERLMNLWIEAAQFFMHAAGEFLAGAVVNG